MDNQDLSLITTGELIEEIGRRERLVLIATIGADDGCGSTRESTKIRVLQSRSSPWEIHGLAACLERHFRYKADEYEKRGLDI
jgi:hypothetical protein